MKKKERKSSKEWVANNWDNWHTNMQKWFTQDLIDTIPMEFVPGGNHDAVLGEMSSVHGKKYTSERKKNARDSIGIGGVRKTLMKETRKSLWVNEKVKRSEKYRVGKSV